MNLPIHNMDDLRLMGQYIAKSGLLKCTNEEQGFIIASICLNEGIGLLEFDSTYDLMNGKISKKSSAILEAFQDLGGKIEIHERSREKAKATFTFGETVLTDELTIETVKNLSFSKDKAGNLKSTWSEFPHSMLWARLVSDCIRAICPKALGGLYSSEEVQDFVEPEQKVFKQVADLEYLVCPQNCGSLSGNLWSDGSVEVLNKYLNLTQTNPQTLDPKYAPFIQQAINNKVNK